MKVIKYLCNPHTLAHYPPPLPPRTCRLERFNYSFSRARLGVIVIIGGVAETGQGGMGGKGEGEKLVSDSQIEAIVD